MNKEIVKVVAEIAVGVFAGTTAANALENLVVTPIKKVVEAKREAQQ
jgi:hypothetical protein